MKNDNKIMKLGELAKHQTLPQEQSTISHPDDKIDGDTDHAIEILMQTLQSIRAIAKKEIN